MYNNKLHVILFYTQLNLIPSSLEKQFWQCNLYFLTRTSVPEKPSPRRVWQTQHLKQSMWYNKPKLSITIAAPRPKNKQQYNNVSPQWQKKTHSPNSLLQWEHFFFPLTLRTFSSWSDKRWLFCVLNFSGLTALSLVALRAWQGPSGCLWRKTFKITHHIKLE